MEKLNRNTGNLLMCILEALIGILLLVNPVGFTSSIIILLGVVLAAEGLFHLVAYFRTDPYEAAQSNAFAKGLLMAVCGLFCVFRSHWFIVTFPVLTVVYGVLTLVAGISKIQWSLDLFRTKQKYWYVAVVGAALSLVFACLILTNPFASTAVLWTFIAVSLLIESVIDVVTLFLEKSQQRSCEKETQPE